MMEDLVEEKNPNNTTMDTHDNDALVGATQDITGHGNYLLASSSEDSGDARQALKNHSCEKKIIQRVRLFYYRYHYFYFILFYFCSVSFSMRYIFNSFYRYMYLDMNIILFLYSILLYVFFVSFDYVYNDLIQVSFFKNPHRRHRIKHYKKLSAM